MSQASFAVVTPIKRVEVLWAIAMGKSAGKYFLLTFGKMSHPIGK